MHIDSPGLRSKLRLAVGFGFFSHFFASFSPVPAFAQESAPGVDADIANASIEQLLNITVTSVSKIPEDLKRAPAAVTVITSDDIHRSGVRTVPEALRLVPGVNVARLDANKYAISIRGFNDRFADKLLVMVDGRSVYDPLFSGTVWETKDVFIEDIDRIEVVRGPGGSTWGSNAVNGVINIITKSAKDTQGGMVVAGGGIEERAFTDVRYGLKLSDTSFLRAYGQYFNRDQGYRPEGADDGSIGGKGGFRFDNVTEDQSLTLQGSFDGGDHDGAQSLDIRNRDSVVQGQWQRNFEDHSVLSMNGYYTHVYLTSPFIDESRDTGEMNVQYNFQPLERFDLASGVQYRLTGDEFRGSPAIALDPDHRVDNLIGVFTQGRVSVIPDELQLTGGVRLEHNYFTNLEVQPSVAFSWSPVKDQVFWGSISRASRIPSRIEHDLVVPLGDQTKTFRGNPDIASEELISYQLGYRPQLTEEISLDVATFFNHYRDLILPEGTTTYENTGRGDAYGVEIAPTWKPTEKMKFTAGYSFLIMNLELSKKSIADDASTAGAIEGSTPVNSAYFRADYDLDARWTCGFDVRYEEGLPAEFVSSYVVADARLAWRVVDDVELSVVGRNLFSGHHFEQGGTNASEVQQGVYGQVAWTF